MTKTIAYLRTSTNNQGFEKDQATILHLANEKTLGKVDFVKETVPIRTNWRERKIGAILEELNSGDRIIVSELAQLGRSILECIEVISTATKKGISVYAVNGNWKLDENTKNMISVTSEMVSEIERGLVSQRTSELLQTRKKASMPLERPRKIRESKLDKIGEFIIMAINVIAMCVR